MKLIQSIAAFTLGASIMTHAAIAAVADAATDPRIDPQIRSFLAKINKDSSPFWELPQPKPQEILSNSSPRRPSTCLASRRPNGLLTRMAAR